MCNPQYGKDLETLSILVIEGGDLLKFLLPYVQSCLVNFSSIGWRPPTDSFHRQGAAGGRATRPPTPRLFPSYTTTTTTTTMATTTTKITIMIIDVLVYTYFWISRLTHPRRSCRHARKGPFSQRRPARRPMLRYTFATMPTTGSLHGRSGVPSRVHFARVLIAQLPPRFSSSASTTSITARLPSRFVSSASTTSTGAQINSLAMS